MKPFYRFVRRLLRFGRRAFFREVETHGLENVPADGPLLLLANHHNGMIDPFLLISTAERPVTFVAKANLFRVPVLGWFLRNLHCMPAWRGEEKDYSKEKNQALYEAGAARLLAGDAIGIFPEGRSHTDPSLAEFKFGASKIAFEAEAKGARVRVQLVGIHFEKTRGFRGKVLLQFGPPVTLEAHRERYAQDPREAIGALTADLHARLSQHVLTAENEELVRLADLVERMGVLDAEGESGLKAVFERKKALLEGYRRLREVAPAEIDELREDLRAYHGFLRSLGVRDDQVAADYRLGRVIRYALRNTLALLAGLPFVAAGLVGNLAPYLAAYGAAKLGKTLDDRTGIAFMASLLAFPAWWAGLALGAGLLAGGWGAAIAAAGAPITGAVALAWMDRWHAVLRETWGLWTALWMRRARAKLRAVRARILARLEKLIERYRVLPLA